MCWELISWDTGDLAGLVSSHPYKVQDIMVSYGVRHRMTGAEQSQGAGFMRPLCYQWPRCLQKLEAAEMSHRTTETQGNCSDLRVSGC